MPWKPQPHRPHGNVPKQRTPDYRPSARKRGYDGAWDKLRALKAANDPTCEICWRDEQRSVPMDEVDHVIPIAVDPSKRLDYDNLMSLCKRHHRIKTLADQKKYSNVQ